MGGPRGEHGKPKAPHLAKGLSNSQELEQGWHLDEPPPPHGDHLELAALDEFIAPLQAQKTMAEGVLARLNRMLELLEDYSFDFDPPQPCIVATTVMMPGMQFFATTGSW